MLLNFQSLGNYAYAYDVKDAATGSINSMAEVGNTAGVASPIAGVTSPIAAGRYPYATAYSFGAPVYPNQAINAPYTYAGRAILAPIVGLGVGLGRGLAFGLRRGADLLSERLNNVLI
ncbi:hypothetical protein AVEN_36306-1 [Araneus ventricosus]|uniref:Uncharacterized protein n=1 Tax=Araneus ventricosus TaxID=182803 RepID=A0A4Y2QGM3_ARAVE|nr:hypothetical protein AVEN_36306-1 [Araneus ventricosus]